MDPSHDLQKRGTACDTSSFDLRAFGRRSFGRSFRTWVARRKAGRLLPFGTQPAPSIPARCSRPSPQSSVRASIVDAGIHGGGFGLVLDGEALRDRFVDRA